MPDTFFSSSKPRKRKRDDSTNRVGKPRTHKKLRKGPSTPPGPTKANGVSRKVRKTSRLDEELSEKSDQEEGAIEDINLRPDAHGDEGSSGAEDENETPAEKRLRLAQLYLNSVKENLADGEFDAREIDKELISARLRQDVMEHSGRVHRVIADTFDLSRRPLITLRTRGHRLSVTSAVATESGKYLFTSGKEGSVIKWDLSTGIRLATFYKVRALNNSAKGKGRPPDEETHGHTDEVLALALSSDGRYLVTSGKDRRLCVWDADKGEWIKTFSGRLGHKDSITALAFRKGTYQLYSASSDRTIIVHDLSPSVMGYVETLFGHQDQILGLDALRGETCVSVGGRDKTVRYWKIVEETQLVFRGGGRSRVREVLEGGLKDDEEDDDSNDIKNEKAKEKQSSVEGSLECVVMVDETTFVSGGDSGSISLWTTSKKKPIYIQPLAHGFHKVMSETEGVIQTPRWVTSLGSLRYSDVIASGSWGGDVRIWKLDSKLKSFSLVGSIPIPGFINSLQFLSPPNEFFESAPWTHQDPQGTPSAVHSRKKGSSILLIAGVGKEHRLGRWLTVKDGVSNGSVVVSLSPRTST